MIALEYRLRSVLKGSEKGDIQLVEGDDGRLYVRRYREISIELLRRLQGVSCPYIERLTERSEDENGTYFISEYIEGTPASDRTFTEKEAVRALLDLCAAIKALHQAGIIHRDIKPANIICGIDGHIRLIDFDSARQEKTCQSRDTEKLGTAGFAPPEQYGFMQTDSRSDIYSFGVTMEEILGENADKPKFRRIINRCMQFDPERRYSDISAVKRAVKRASHPNFAPLAAAVVIIAAGMVMFLRQEPPPAPPGKIQFKETTDAGSIEAEITAETEPPTAEPTEELTDETTREPFPETTETISSEAVSEQTNEPPEAVIDESVEEQIPEEQDNLPPEQPEIVPEITEPAIEETTESAAENTTESAAEVTTESAAEVTAESTAEVTAESTAEVTTESTAEVTAESTSEATAESTVEAVSATIEAPEPERTPNILSDSINPDKMPFETVQDDDGQYEDIFDYVFYDDPAVCGNWRLGGILAPDTDFEAITAGELTFFGSFEDFVWQYLTIFPDGTYVMRYTDKNVFVRSRWTNGYCISFDQDRSFVRRMFEVTVDGVEYLMWEQKPSGGHLPDIPHRFLVFMRDE